MKKKGFTLVEVMITLAIFIIFSLYLYQTFFLQIKQSFGFYNNIDDQLNISKALNMITDTIRNNVKYEDNASGPKINIINEGRTVKSDGNTIINYDDSSRILKLNSTTNLYNISDFYAVMGDASKNENELIIITVKVYSNTKNDISSSTAINIKR